MDDAKLEGADRGRAVDGVLLVLRGQLAALLQVLHDLAQVDVDARAALEAEVELDAEDEVGAVSLHAVIHGIRLAQHVHADEPVGLGALLVLVEDGIEDVAVDALRVLAAVEIDEVVGQQGQGLVVVEAAQVGDVVGEAERGAVFMFELGAAVPDHHDREQQQGQDHGDVAAVGEFAEAGEEEDRLDRAEDQQQPDAREPLAADLAQVDGDEQRGHQHGHGDGEAVGRFHPRAGAEVEHHHAAADPEDGVDRGDIELALGLGGVADLQVGQQVEQDSLGHQRVGAGDEGLGGDDRGRRAEDDGEGAQRRRKHQEEGVEVFNGVEGAVGLVLDDPGALAQIVEDQAELDEGPAEVDVLLADVAHVGIQRFGAGGGEEDAAEDHEARLVVGAEEHAHGVERVEGAQHCGQRRDVQQAGDAEEGEPEQHHRAEGLADAAGAGVLDGEEHGDDEQGDEHHLGLARAEKAAHGIDAAQALDRGGHGDGRREHAVGQQRGAAQHGGQDQPFAAVLHQRVERENAALAVVVGLHGNQHVFDGGQQGDGPDHEGQGADEEALVHVGDAAVALQDGLHHVHRRGADVAVDDPDGHKKETEAEFFVVVHKTRSFLR